ncbi:MAG TPA: DNA-binding protein [Ignavibacteriales bacterium]|nr:DNA-binding protein [Ignavibacteriales bacterium]
MNIQIKIEASSINDLKSLIRETVEKAVKETLLKKNILNNTSNDELLTRTEVMEMLKVSHATLYNYQMKGIIPYKKIGNRVYFNKSDIIDNPDLEGY